ncbi:uncharacterized protein BDZ99DRAFT_573256 [Mytilinidion resinicola]|uniref:C2H2-type domain-containing protein n=1 Tax=Mytilinidion resinicola TaxID=574789 RepID=A0A6A6YHQ0_9PEZI|nr:uncharacterized protein BDZ99DRAFT_573256 [Mytilinidion resinicola]KAF2807427.1 hypothetical protein BDZ99DRAFT_573256 [Mytilinidion resinicola]
MTATLVATMGTTKTLPAEPDNVIESLLHTLLETFTATRDLHKTLRIKEKRDHEAIKTLKGYPESRRNYYVDSDGMDEAGENAISLDKSAVKREFQRGYSDLGHRYAMGDVITQTELQAQIIALQGTLVTVFLYGPTSPHPISHHLTTILSASKTASINAVHSLAAQYQRMITAFPQIPRSPPSPPPYPATVPPARPRSASLSRSRPSTALVPSRHASTHTKSARPLSYPASSRDSLPAALPMPYPSTRSSTPTTSLTNPSPTSNHALFCPYALHLQTHPHQPLSPALTSSTPSCPSCARTLNLTPGRTWEVRKTDIVLEHDARGRRDSVREREIKRVFQVNNRFVVKCHRAGPEGGYSCVICARDDGCEADTVCGDVKALVRHVWMEHEARELEGEVDVVEVREEGDWWGRGSRRRSWDGGER